VRSAITPMHDARSCATLPRMLRSRRSPFGVCVTVIAAIFACAVLASVGGVADAATSTTSNVYVSESLPTLESQLRSGDVHAVVVRVKSHKVHAALSDGRKVTVAYVPEEEEKIIAVAKARGVPVTVVKPKTEGIRAHHKLRYIAGGILIVAIIIVVVVLLLNRRRKREAEIGMA
jgi:hypothetical protein